MRILYFYDTCLIQFYSLARKCDSFYCTTTLSIHISWKFNISRIVVFSRFSPLGLYALFLETEERGNTESLTTMLSQSAKPPQYRKEVKRILQSWVYFSHSKASSEKLHTYIPSCFLLPLFITPYIYLLAAFSQLFPPSFFSRLRFIFISGSTYSFHEFNCSLHYRHRRLRKRANVKGQRRIHSVCMVTTVRLWRGTEIAIFRLTGRGWQQRKTSFCLSLGFCEWTIF